MTARITPRRCIHGRTERQRCAKCNAMDALTTRDTPDPRAAPEEQGLTPEGATRDTPEAVCPTCGGAVTVTEPYRTDMPGVLDSRNVRRYAAIPGWTLVPSVGVTVVATDLWKSTVEMAAELPERMEAEAEIARLRAALDAIIHELGVPGEGYPTPVANAYDIARAALAPQEASDGDH